MGVMFVSESQLKIEWHHMEWLDNADSYICPVCRTEVSSPAAYNYHCPWCGFIAERDKNKCFELVKCDG